MEEEEKYMLRCIQIARNGFTRTEPNPMVGAVVVCDGRIIGEGYHARFGGPHAEVNAIGAVRHPEWLSRSTLYVSLEPCSHYGKTPPCADLILEKRIPRVVVGCIDPFARVAGRGIRRLREAGVDVRVGVCEARCRALNERFMVFHEQHRPFVTLKWAESADRYIDTLRRPSDGATPYRFSTPYTQMLVHKRRAEHKAILVGTNTARLDNPSLNVRHWVGEPPLRLVIDKDGSLPETLRLWDGTQPTVVYTERPDAFARRVLRPTDVVPLDASKNIVHQILDDLYHRQITSLLVEGGGRLLTSFIEEDLWDEACVECADVCIGEGVPAPELPLSGALCREETFMGRRILRLHRG